MHRFFNAVYQQSSVWMRGTLKFMQRARTILFLLFLCGFAVMSVRAQPNVERPRANNVDQLVASNIEFFERLLTSVATLSGVPRQDYLQHLNMNGAHAR